MKCEKHPDAAFTNINGRMHCVQCAFHPGIPKEPTLPNNNNISCDSVLIGNEPFGGAPKSGDPSQRSDGKDDCYPDDIAKSAGIHSSGPWTAHDKVYPAEHPGVNQPWICRKCGKEGIDMARRKLDEYSELKLKFKDKS